MKLHHKSPRKVQQKYRKTEIAKSIVTISRGDSLLLFDGDEKSQDRICRQLMILEELETTEWILADNTQVVVTKEELKCVLRKAVKKQQYIWLAGR